MTGVLKNQLLLWSLAAVAAYMVAGFTVPNPYISSTMSLLLLIFGSVTFARYAPDSFRILFLGERSDAGDGGHLAAYGVSLVALGSMWVGLFGLTWVYVGQPSSWLGTPMSGAGRGIQAAGFALLFFAPDVTKRRFRLPGGAWLIMGLLVAALAVFLLGWRMGQQENMATFRTARLAAGIPQCEPARPIMGSTRMIYHTSLSPYRELVVPTACFASEAEARAAGFRAPL